MTNKKEKQIDVYEVKFPSEDWHVVLIIIGSVSVIMLLVYIITTYWPNGRNDGDNNGQMAMQNKIKSWRKLGFGPALGLPQI